MTILVTGANGQLGRELRALAQLSEQRHHRWVFADITDNADAATLHLDITDAYAVEKVVSDESVDFIVNCAAWTDVNGAESHEELAYRLNAEAPRILAETMQRAGGWLIHISTDYVFGGNHQNTPCDEETQGTPTGAYGRTKLAGEQAVAATGVKYIILRTAWLYSPWGKNFVKTMLNLTNMRPTLNVVVDQVGTPTNARGLAEAICTIISTPLTENHKGVYHYSDEGVTSWYDFAVAIARMAGHNTCRISPCRSADYPSPVERPAYSVLDKTKIKRTFGIELRHWMECLAECIDILKLNA